MVCKYMGIHGFFGPSWVLITMPSKGELQSKWKYQVDTRWNGAGRLVKHPNRQGCWVWYIIGLFKGSRWKLPLEASTTSTEASIASMEAGGRFHGGTSVEAVPADY